MACAPCRTAPRRERTRAAFFVVPSPAPSVPRHPAPPVPRHPAPRPSPAAALASADEVVACPTPVLSSRQPSEPSPAIPGPARIRAAAPPLRALDAYGSRCDFAPFKTYGPRCDFAFFHTYGSRCDFAPFHTYGFRCDFAPFHTYGSRCDFAPPILDTVASATRIRIE